MAPCICMYSRACCFTDGLYRLYQNLPRLRFNKEGNLLAVTTADSGFKILANSDGLRTLRAYEARSFEASKASIEMKVGIMPYYAILKRAFCPLTRVSMSVIQVSSSAMASGISPAIGKIEHMDTGSPARPTPIPVCIFFGYILCYFNRETLIYGPVPLLVMGKVESWLK